MFKRLPFGISSAQDVFQAVMSEMFEDIEGVEVVVDDIIIWGTTQEEHDTTLEKVLQRATERNLKLNKDKSQMRLKQISYIGHVLGEDGIKPDPQKVRAISEMERPDSLSGCDISRIRESMCLRAAFWVVDGKLSSSSLSS